MNMEDLTERIKTIESTDSQIQMRKENSAKAYLLWKNHHLPRKLLVQYFGCSQAAITRAASCVQEGYNASEAGRHQMLCDYDEELLECTILDLLEEGQVVYGWQVIEMV